jgi:hypothetical protein
MIFAILLIGLASCVDLSGSWSEQAFSDTSTVATTPGTSSQSPSQDQQSYTKYAQYFSMDSGEAPSGGESNVASFDIKGQQPTTLFVGGQQQKAVSYSQIQPYATFTGGNTLWIQGTSSWTQYAQVPQGASLNLIASTPMGGNANFYEIYPSGKLDKGNYYFSPNNRISFYADEIGQHILMFVINNQVSNSIIIDVVPFYGGPIYSGPTYPGPTLPGPVIGKAKINIISSTLKGYDVYVDDIYQFTEGEGGFADGKCSFVVPGNSYHKISIKKGGYRYTQSKFISSGREYTLLIN